MFVNMFFLLKKEKTMYSFIAFSLIFKSFLYYVAGLGEGDVGIFS